MVNPSQEQKLRTVIEHNTFFFKPVREVEEADEKSVAVLVNSLLSLRQKVALCGCKEEVFVEHLQSNPNGLDCLLAITGFSAESLKRLLTFVKVKDDPSLNALLCRDLWKNDEPNRDEPNREWSLDEIRALLKKNRAFAEGIVRLFFKGKQEPVLQEILPLFEFNKLDVHKLQFSKEALIDTIARYRLKGTLKASKESNPERVIEQCLQEEDLKFERGKLPKVRRTLDFIIPSKQSPRLVIECSYVATTSSGMGDKAKTEKEVRRDLQRYYKDVLFWGFVDGIGWFVRRKDLERMVSAFDDVFTFADEEIQRFRQRLREVFKQAQAR
jgi:hypothetical protein